MFIVGLSVTVVFTALFFFIPRTAIPAAFALEMLRQLAYGFTIPLLWAMMADVADYSEWKNRRRATAIVFSAIVFGLKAGLGFGGAIGGWVLSAYGYVPNVAQTESALQGIRLTASLFPAATFLISVVCLFFYKIDRNLEIQITTSWPSGGSPGQQRNRLPLPDDAQSIDSRITRRERNRGSRRLRVCGADARRHSARAGDRNTQGRLSS